MIHIHIKRLRNTDLSNSLDYTNTMLLHLGCTLESLEEFLHCSILRIYPMKITQ